MSTTQILKNTLHITTIQTHLVWENAAANRDHFDGLLKNINNSDLVILPEMFTTGFTMNAKALAEKPSGITLSWMQQWAKRLDAAITGSLVIEENDDFYNRLYFVYPDGSFNNYDKKHTFTLAEEHLTYTAGKERLIIDYLGWKICPLICYDLRFPVWARNTVGYDLLLYVANWPKTRIAAWDALLKARAIENMVYCAGVNRIGLDGKDFEYVGHSAVYDPLGALISSEEMETDLVQTITLNKTEMTTTRNKLKFLQDRDSFNLV